MKVLVWWLHLKMAFHSVESWESLSVVVHWEHLTHVLWLDSLLQVLLSIKRACLDEAVTVV